MPSRSSIEDMSATNLLRKDHENISRLEKIIEKCYKKLYSGDDIPFEDIERITLVISEFLDAIHYSREEDSYFSCVGIAGDFKEEIRKFMIEHQFGRNIAHQISKHLQSWKSGKDSREPVSRFLRTYSIYLQDHLSKENKFFDKAEKSITIEEEKEMYEYFQSVIATSKKLDDMIKEIEYLESCSWYVE